MLSDWPFFRYELMCKGPKGFEFKKHSADVFIFLICLEHSFFLLFKMELWDYHILPPMELLLTFNRWRCKKKKKKRMKRKGYKPSLFLFNHELL